MIDETEGNSGDEEEGEWNKKVQTVKEINESE